ncbi:MAG: universal stress protein [Desulfobacterales bacterium]|nr:universal stress protein [Desulfobacterales bacterium]
MRIKPKKIMCAVDFSDFTNIILSYGKSLASEFGSTLCLCHIVSGTLMISSFGHSYIAYTDVKDDRIRYAKDKLKKIAESEVSDIDCEIIVSYGHAADEIDQAARENNVDMVIAATHGGSGVKRFLIGSVTDRLIKILTCPLLVLHARENYLVSPVEKSIKLNRILVGCDFSQDSKLAFDYALSLAQEFQTQLYLAHVIRPNEDLKEKSNLSSRLEEQLACMVPEESRNWCTPVTIQLEGQPYKELIDFAEQKEVDMIVLGVHGHSLLEQFIVGSTTDRVISQASCPVLVVRQVS